MHLVRVKDTIEGGNQKERAEEHIHATFKDSKTKNLKKLRSKNVFLKKSLSQSRVKF